MDLQTRKPIFGIKKTDNDNVMTVHDNDSDEEIVGKIYRLYDRTMYIEIYRNDDKDDNREDIVVSNHPKFADGEPVKTFEGALSYLEFIIMQSEQYNEIAETNLDINFDEYEK